MAFFSSRFSTATVVDIRHCGAGFVRDENEERLFARDFEGKTGKVIEMDDTGYDTERPTGEEPTYYLVDFDGQKVWIEEEALKLRV